MRKGNPFSVFIKGSSSLERDSKAVPSPNADYNILLQAVELNAPGSVIFLPPLSRLFYYNSDLLGIILFLVDSGCRIQECLDMELSDFVALNSVRIKSKKGSNERIVTLGYSRNYMLQCRLHHRKPFSFINYMYIYRAFKELGIFDQFGQNKVNSVTHYFRHINQIMLKKDGVETKTISQNMGHKSLKSTNHYLKHGKKTK